MTGRPSSAAGLVTVLGAVVLSISLLQTGVVPVLDVIAAQLTASPVAVSWAVTANLLAAAAATPLIGRLADLHNKKHVLLVVLTAVLAGSLLAATTSSVPLLVLARVLQGSAFALYPVAVSILRDELPDARLIRAIAVLSAMLGVGGGLGLVVTGLLMGGGASYHRVFWVAVAFTAALLTAAAAVVPNRRGHRDASVDWVGGLGLAAGLTAVLLALTQGRSWGWSSPETLVVAAIGVTVLGAWWWWSRRCREPLISTVLLTERPILLANLATLLVGMGVYFSFLGLTDVVEAPAGSGFGFGASVLRASVEFLLPGSVAAAVTALISGRCIERFGAAAVIMAGSGAGLVGFVLLAGWHSTAWQVIVAGLLTNAYISLAYGALPALLVQHVDAARTGVLTSLNSVVRTVGGAVAAAVVAVLLTASAGDRDFVAVFAMGAATAAGSIVLIALMGRRPAVRPIEP
jgi:MFS family permease